MLLKLEHSSNKKPNGLWQFSDDTQDMGALEKRDMAGTEAAAAYWVLTSWCKHSKGIGTQADLGDIGSSAADLRNKASIK